MPEHATCEVCGQLMARMDVYRHEGREGHRQCVLNAQPRDQLCAVCHADTKPHCANPACDWWVCLDEAGCRTYGTDEHHTQRPKQEGTQA